MADPKLFVSYSWSSPDHEAWVLRLSTELRESGVDVILDKWDLKEGQDTYAFMEKMVTDPDVQKVVMVCDKLYAEKADVRRGGVGTETQIISKEVYDKADQTKFVALLLEVDEEGKPYLPIYYKSRRYIDFHNAEQYSESFEELLRWVYDQPLHVKPELGTKPSFLDRPDMVSLGTSVKFKRALDAITTGKPYASGALSEYFESTASALEKLRITDTQGNIDDKVVESIELFIPHRNEIAQIFLTLARYENSKESIPLVHAFFESLIPYLHPPAGTNRWAERDYDNFKFIIHELFLYCIAAFLKYERFETVKYLVENLYLDEAEPDYGREAMTGFPVFWQHLESLDERNRRLQLQRASLHADFLLERNAGSGIDKVELMQADFVLLLRAGLDVLRQNGVQLWWPSILLYKVGKSSPFRLFARSESAAYFSKFGAVIGIDNREEIVPLLAAYETKKLDLPQWRHMPSRVKEWMNFERLATQR
ncbi:MAG: toll/interleukin-1 receptor domain-containing protein [Desulfomonile tiedjei]|nr:toll/interleukin-1 receptor domain-containing protein [Desulfomonile tiedjei]